METFSNNSSVEIEKLLDNKDFVLGKLDKKIQLQVQLTRDSEISPKNTTLYFNLLLKNKDIYKHKIEIIRIFFDINNKIT
jgi:mRNA-degrading endonuclease RelE of RelBE toxin-antitoxin system